MPQPTFEDLSQLADTIRFWYFNMYKQKYGFYPGECKHPVDQRTSREHPEGSDEIICLKCNESI
jgi:hypothetical protein